MREKLQNQSGVSIIAAIFIIVILAFMGMVFLTLFTATSVTSINELQSTQALYVAEGGMERAVRLLNSPILSAADADRRRACSEVSAVLANIPLGSGQFTASQDASSPYYLTNAPTLSASISAATPSPIDYIRISNSTGLATFGRVMIDRELFDYTSIGTTAAECGGGASPCLRGVMRARDGTTAADHAGPPNAARVGQNQCTVTSTGGIYNLAAPNARRQVREGIQIQEGWAVGDTGVILRWDGTSWVLFTTTVTQLRGVSMDSYANGWTVGEVTGMPSRAQIRRWNPDGTPAWDSVAAPAQATVRLNAVHTISYNEAWAVGNDRGGGPNALILQYTSAGWSYLDPGVDLDFNGVFMLDLDNDGDADDGWAVGESNGTRPTVFRWNIPCGGGVGTGIWNNCTSAPYAPAFDRDLNSVYMLSSSDGWAVGNRRGCANPGLTILRYSGGAWACPAGLLVVDRNLNSVFMLDLDNDGDADDGWTVGNNGTILRWNYNCTGTAQNNQWNNCTGATNQRLNSVFCVNASDCWAVGNGGTIVHWDGSAWTTHPQSGVVTGQNLNSVYVISPKQRPQAMWREVFQ